MTPVVTCIHEIEAGLQRPASIDVPVSARETAARLTRGYKSLLDRYCAPLDSAEWTVTDTVSGNLIWRTVARRGRTLPSQGWKLHLSAAAVEAGAFLCSVLPILIRRNATFKLPAYLNGIVLLNGGQAGASQIGKIVTVYPNCDAQLAELAEEIFTAWPESRGPDVAGEYRIGRGPLFLRYGSFGGGREFVDPSGRHHTAILAPDGQTVKDERAARPPEWAPPPPVSCAPPASTDLAGDCEVGGRPFIPLRLMQSTPRGSLLLGIAADSVETVVLKTAKAGVGGDLLGYDARDRLIREHRFLLSLDGSGIAPRPLALGDGRTAILAMEALDGHLLTTLDRTARIRSLPALAQTIARLHDCGIVHRDLKLAHAVECGGQVRLLDFEMAAEMGATDAPLGGTEGYVPPDAADHPVSAATDVFAFGVCVAHACLDEDPAYMTSRTERLPGLLHLSGAHAAATVVKALTVPDAAARPTAREAARLVASHNLEPCAPVSTQWLKRMTNAEALKRAACESGAATRQFRETGAGQHAWRNNHFDSDFLCQGINLGAAGIVLGLASLRLALGTSHFDSDITGGANWLASRAPSPAAGLFMGNAGVALSLAVVGKLFREDHWILAATERLHSCRKCDGELDLFAGSAGVVWAACLMSSILHDDNSMNSVRPHAERLLASAFETDGLILWPRSGNSGQPYLGAAHGAAGIAMALGIWGHKCGDESASALAANAFQQLYLNGRDDTGTAFLESLQGPSAGIPNWCHGVAGYLWCLLQTFGDDERFAAAIDWSVGQLASLPPTGNPTYCHGLAGRLELWRMIGKIPRHRACAVQQSMRTAAALRLLQERRGGTTVWNSEEPGIVTPDLWIGFLGPATALALFASGAQNALLSEAWLGACAGK